MDPDLEEAGVFSDAEDPSPLRPGRGKEEEEEERRMLDLWRLDAAVQRETAGQNRRGGGGGERGGRGRKAGGRSSLESSRRFPAPHQEHPGPEAGSPPGIVTQLPSSPQAFRATLSAMQLSVHRSQAPARSCSSLLLPRRLLPHHLRRPPPPGGPPSSPIPEAMARRRSQFRKHSVMSLSRRLTPEELQCTHLPQECSRGGCGETVPVLPSRSVSIQQVYWAPPVKVPKTTRVDLQQWTVTSSESSKPVSLTSTHLRHTWEASGNPRQVSTPCRQEEQVMDKLKKVLSGRDDGNQDGPSILEGTVCCGSQVLRCLPVLYALHCGETSALWPGMSGVALYLTFWWKNNGLALLFCILQFLAFT
ncbi:vesicle transport protein SFT2B [Lates japonicus]|uniref:Vesicle transport protein SFT2B n=1 Tax=Lates japonicus TaxID=270547 RepID=A0AAD3RGN0_LATJO|nr:vesicle transport protein SFT2B [Lates japonicus]